MEKSSLNKNYTFAILDVFITVIALSLASLLHYDLGITSSDMNQLYQWAIVLIPCQFIIFYFTGLYSRIWQYTGLVDLFTLIRSSVLSGLVSFTILSFGKDNFALALFFIFGILNLILVASSRLSVRVFYTYISNINTLSQNSNIKKLLLIGAGKTGDKIAREILSTSRHQFKIVGFIDDDLEKQNLLLHGKKVFCRVSQLHNLKVAYDEILITAPSATGDQMRVIVDACKKTGKRYKTVPSLVELIYKEVSLDTVRDVNVSDLLGRDEVKLDMNSIDKMIQGKRILITGAGGSIGSELVKQSLLFKPSEIICIDISEEKIYYLEQMAAKMKIGDSIIRSVLASVNSKKEMEKVFNEYRPQIVFHAAAYKHVFIQETFPWNAIKTNVGGTLNVILTSDKFKVEKFVLVSTDKAVNPVNIMGATKRLSEKLIQSYNIKSNTKYMAVRFGNVLGSSGSAIPTFQKQINEGGPLTITHPEMTRYFMSIQEATQLIIQCGALGKDGEIFVLEMGKPIKIIDMAKDLIRLSGFEPDKDIPIVYTGLRSGEKLYEELMTYEENTARTQYKKIMVLKSQKGITPWEQIFNSTLNLMKVSEDFDLTKIQSALKRLLPTFQPTNINLPLEQDSINDAFIKGEA